MADDDDDYIPDCVPDDCDDDPGGDPGPPNDPDNGNVALIVFFVFLLLGVLYSAYDEQFYSEPVPMVLNYKCNPNYARTPVSKFYCGIYAKPMGIPDCGRQEKVCTKLKGLEYAEYKCKPFKGFDLALASNGGGIVSTLDTIPYPAEGCEKKCREYCDGKAKNILTPEMATGNSWPFVGKGDVIINILQPCIILGFAIHHPENLTVPEGFTVSAPKYFSVHGLKESSSELFLFGNYKYSIEGRGSQYYAIHHFSSDKYRFLQFSFESNHGNPIYTTVYRISVFGDTGDPWFYNPT